MICNSFGIEDIHALRRDFKSCIFVLRAKKKGAVKKLLSQRTRLVEKKSLVFLCRRSGKEGKKGARKKAVVEKSKNSC